jgi:adenylate cyclase
MSKFDLLGPEDTWSLAGVATWLSVEGRRLQDPLELIEALSNQLEGAGAKVDRIAVMSRTLHPQFAGWSVRWSKTLGLHRGSIEHRAGGSDAFIGSPVQYVQESKRSFRQRISTQAQEGEHGLVRDLRQAGITDYLALPMAYGDSLVSVLSFATASVDGFSETDIARYNALANLLSPLIEIIGVRRTTLGLLNTFVGPRIGERILHGQVKRGDGEKIDAAFWYSDLRGFTNLSETLPTPELLSLLNDYFENCAAAATARGGEILQFIGDAILIVFEIGKCGDRANVCAAALDAAVEAFSSIAVLNHRRKRAGHALIEFGLGLHVGTVTHANVGSPDRLAFNVVGPAVNTTARIQSMSKELHTPLLMSAEFSKHIQTPLKSLGSHDLRGVASAQELFTVSDELRI